VRTQDRDRPWVTKLVKAFQSPEVKQFVGSTISGSMVPAF
jgi:D-methionine transport system substrate-binding protein